jgi:IclR family pca regulon transcriptional regulator
VRLRKLLESCADKGYALSNEEIEVGVRSIAVPLYNFGGSVVGALSLSSRADRMTASEMIEQLLPAMLRSQSWVRSRLS